MYRDFELQAAIAKAIKALNGVDKYITEIKKKKGAAYIKCAAADDMIKIEFMTNDFKNGNASPGIKLSCANSLEIEVCRELSNDEPVKFKCHAIKLIASDEQEISELIDGFIELGKGLAYVKGYRETFK